MIVAGLAVLLAESERMLTLPRRFAAMRRSVARGRRVRTSSRRPSSSRTRTSYKAQATVPYLDLRTPDAASHRVSSTPDVAVVKVREQAPAVDDGLDWGDAGIGAGAVLPLVVAIGGTLLLIRRRHGGAGRRHATPVA